MADYRDYDGATGAVAAAENSNQIEDDGAYDVYQLSDLDQELVDELRYVRQERKLLEEREAKLRKELLENLGPATVGRATDGTTAVTIKRHTRRNVSSTKLEAMWPDIFEQVVSESEIITLNLP